MLLVALAALALAAMADDLDDPEDLVGPWILVTVFVGAPLAALTAWLQARIERRLDPVRRPRGLYLLEGAGHVGFALWWPLAAWAPLLAFFGVVEGSWRLVSESLVLSVAWVAAGSFLGARWAARHYLAQREPLTASRAPWTTLGDLVPTSVIAGGWATFVSGLLCLPIAAEARHVSTFSGMFGVVALVAIGVALAVSAHAFAPFARPDAPFARLELGGGLAVGTLWPLFVAMFSLGNPDVMWFGIGLSGLGLLGAAGAWGVGRSLRRDLWLTG